MTSLEEVKDRSFNK